MSKSIAYKHYMRALSRWPADPLRPEVQFQKAMQKRLDRRFVAAPTGSDKYASTTGSEAAELQQANVLYSLLDNRYSKKYPLSDAFMRPTSNPTYYEDLIKELDEAPDRSWWASKLKGWQGFLRFK